MVYSSYNIFPPPREKNQPKITRAEHINYVKDAVAELLESSFMHDGKDENVSISISAIALLTSRPNRVVQTI